MSFPKYPEYKDSGVEWLGEVPAHWEITPLKYVATYNDEVLPESTPDDYPIKYVEISDVDDQLGITGWSEHSFSSAPSRARRILKDGDVLISTVRTYLRAIAPVIEPPENLVCSTGFAAIRPVPGVYHSALLGYTLRAEWFISHIIARSVGVSYPAINASDLAALSLPVPPWKEQQSIAAFLDHEIARIDALVEEQQRLIELLKEKRQAVISHAVTKGLDPDVPMKDSGVEWLGEVPAHWGLKRLGDIVEFSQGKAHEPFVDADGEYICVNSRFVSTNGRSVKRCTKNLTPAKKGDVLMVMSDLPNGRALARSFLVEQSDLYAVNQRVCRIRPVAAFSLFLFYLLDRHPSLLFKDDGFNQTHLSGGDFTQLKLYLPPGNEQSEIVEYLGSHTSQIDGLLVESHKNVALLKERRSALISAAVTGKIDVRGWQPPAGSSAPNEATQTEMV